MIFKSTFVVGIVEAKNVDNPLEIATIINPAAAAQVISFSPISFGFQ